MRVRIWTDFIFLFFYLLFFFAGLPAGAGFCDKTIPCASGAPTSFTCALGPTCSCNAAGWCSFVGDVTGTAPIAIQPGSVLTVQGSANLQGSLSVQATTVAPLLVATGTVTLSGPLHLTVDPALIAPGNTTFLVAEGGTGLTGQFSSVAILGAQNCSNITSQQSVAASLLSVTVSVNNAMCPSPGGSSDALSPGAIAGVVVGVVVVGVIIAASVALARAHANHMLEKDFSNSALNDLRNASPYTRM